MSGILITFIVFEMIDDISDPRYRRMLNQKEYRERMEQEAEAELLQDENDALALRQSAEEASLALLKSSEAVSKGSGGGGGMLGKKKKPTGDWSGNSKAAAQGHGAGAGVKEALLAKKQAEALTPEALELEEWQAGLLIHPLNPSCQPILSTPSRTHRSTHSHPSHQLSSPTLSTPLHSNPQARHPAPVRIRPTRHQGV